MRKSKKMIAYLLALLLTVAFLAKEAKSFDADAISQVSEGIAEWNLMNDGGKNQDQKESTLYLTSTLVGLVERESRSNLKGISGLKALDSQKYDVSDFKDYINGKETIIYHNTGMPGSVYRVPQRWGNIQEKTYSNLADPFSYVPTVYSLSAIPVGPHRMGEPQGYAPGFQIKIPFGQGESNKTYFWDKGGHSFEAAYKDKIPPLPNSIMGHSQGNFAVLDKLYKGGDEAVRPFKGYTILGAGANVDIGKKQIPTGFTGTFGGDVFTRGVPGAVGIQFPENPLDNIALQTMPTTFNTPSFSMPKPASIPNFQTFSMPRPAPIPQFQTFSMPNMPRTQSMPMPRIQTRLK